MEPMYSAHKQELLQWARTALAYGVAHGHAPPVHTAEFSPGLCEQRAVFITLMKDGRLRGCIGHLEATQPLVNDIAENAVAAALEDPRFPPVTSAEIPAISIAISVLTPPEPLAFKDEADLLQKLRPGIDGLIIGEGRRRATFLPSVWEELPDPRDFLQHLKMKAGWPPGYWSERIQAWRYESVYLSEDEPE